MLVPDMVITNGYNVVGTKQLAWDKFPVAAEKFVALMSFDRGQFYNQYEEFRSRQIVLTVLGTVLLGVLVEMATRRLHSEALPMAVVNEQAYGEFSQLTDNPTVNKLRGRFSAKTRALEFHLSCYPVCYDVIRDMESGSMRDESGSSSTDSLQVPAREALQRYAGIFVQDMFKGRDTELNLSIMLAGCKTHDERCTYCRMTSWARSAGDNKCWVRSVLIFMFQIWGLGVYQFLSILHSGGSYS